MIIKIHVLLFMFESFLMVNSFTNVMVDGGSIQINNGNIFYISIFRDIF